MAKWVINFNNEPIFLLFAQVCEKLQNGTTHSWLRNCIVFFVGTFSTADRQKRIQPWCISTRLLQKWTSSQLVRALWFYIYLWRCLTTFESVCCVVWTCLPGIPGMNTWCSATFTYCCVLVWPVQCFHIPCSSPFYIEKHCPNSSVYRRGNCSLIPDIGCLQPKSKIRYIQEFYLPHQAKMEFFLEFCFLYQTLCS